MRDLPIFHPRKGSSSKYSIRAKQALLGTRRFDTNRLRDAFPGYLTEDTTITIKDRENILASTYEADSAYFIKVITPRHVKLHKLLTGWRNTVFKMSRLPKPFATFETPLEMAEYEFNAATHTADEGGAIVKPYSVTNIPGRTNAAAILYDYVPNAGKLTDNQKSLKAFEHIVQTMRRLHDGGYVHTSIPYHIVQSVPTGEPYLTDPVGRTHNTQKDHLIGVGFDITCLLAIYTPHVGALPALNTVEKHYSDVELVAAFKTSGPLQVTVPGTSPWVISHLRTSIDEYASPDAVDTYLEIVGEEYDTVHPAPDGDNTHEFSTGEFIETALDSTQNEHSNETQQTELRTTPHATDRDDDNIRLHQYQNETGFSNTTTDPLTEYTDQNTTVTDTDTGAETRPSPETLPNKNTDSQSADDTQSTPNTDTETPSTEQTEPTNQKPLADDLEWAGDSHAENSQPTDSTDEDNSQSVSLTERLKTIFS